MPDRKKKVGTQATNAYKRADVLTVNRETLLLMLYEGAIRFLKQAIEAQEKKNVAEQGRLVMRTMDIVNELRATLNFETGGQLATSLEQLYLFISDRLTASTVTTQPDNLQEALGILTTLHTGWEQAIQNLRKQSNEPKA